MMMTDSQDSKAAHDNAAPSISDSLTDLWERVLRFARTLTTRDIPLMIGWVLVALGVMLVLAEPGYQQTILAVVGAIIVTGERISAAIRESKT